MSREITTHKGINDLNDLVRVAAVDAKGPGGANHKYAISWDGVEGGEGGMLLVEFQNGPVKEAGVNAPSMEAYLAVLIDRLECHQAGEYACAENERALGDVRSALNWLRMRTKNRQERGVEGTKKV